MIPVKIDELTPQYFEDSLKPKLGHDCKIVCADVRPAFLSKRGFMATHIRATVVATSSGRKKELFSLFVKLVPLDDPMFMELLKMIRFDIREIRFFEEVSSVLAEHLAEKCTWDLPIPRLVFAAYSPEEPKSILVLQDSTEDGFKSKCLSEGWDLPHLLLGIRTLARINAASISYMKARGLTPTDMEKTLPSLAFDWYAFENAEAFHIQCIDDLKVELDKYDEGKEDDEEELKQMLESTKSWDRHWMMQRYQKGMQGPFVALAQRDCWNNNFMFKYDPATGEPTEAILCDWQWASVFTVTADLASLIYTSVDADLRSNCLDYLLKEYYRALSHALNSLGSPLPPEADFEAFTADFQDIGVHCAFEALKVLRIAFSRSDDHFPGSPIMRRFCATLREVLRIRKASGWE